MKNMWRFVKNLDAIKADLQVTYTLDCVSKETIERTAELEKQCEELTQKALHRDWSAVPQITKFIEKYGY